QTGEQTTPDTEAGGTGEDSLPVYNDGGETKPVEKVEEGFALPVAGKLGTKHDASVQVWSPTMEEYRIHLGIDIATEDDAPVYAAANGTVAQIWEDPMMGTCVAISHEGDVVTIYKNLSANLAEGIVAGKAVKVGQQIGTVGGTATLEMAEAPHLHFEMTEGGLSVDPLDYFSDKDIKTLNSYEDATEGTTEGKKKHKAHLQQQVRFPVMRLVPSLYMTATIRFGFTFSQKYPQAHSAYAPAPSHRLPKARLPHGSPT
ncbi:MAG: M23 family metallopeptidase, partial [Clostridia bacterium]|nr:M23 family metallopeptidase [Clostridia bacterium]